MTEILIAILGGSALGSTLSALINQIGNYVSERRRRKDGKEDEEDTRDAAIKQGVKLLADKLQYLGLKFMNEGEITFTNRKILNEMHSTYHNGLGGNGDFDGLMKEVNELPLKG